VATFAYTALEPSGKKRTGFVDAASKDAAVAIIAAEGRFVVDIREQAVQSSTSNTKDLGKKKGKASKSDLALFSRRLSDLALAGLPLDRVLHVVAEQSESQMLADVAEQALEEVRGGKPISEALAMHPKLFPPIFCQTLKAGEASGQFGEVAQRLADFQEREVARKSQVISALIYPAILATTAVGVVIFLMSFVVPKLSGVFHDLGSDLPGSTRLLLAMSNFFQTQYMMIIVGVIGIIVAYRAWSATAAGALQRDTLFLKAPILGPVISKATVSRFARVLGTLLYGGVPILEALELSGLASGNLLFQKSAGHVLNDVREGRPIAESMRDAGAFPPVLTHMVAIGEETGELPKMLGRVSDSLDFEVDNGMRRLTAMVEPIIVLAMGGIVGFVVLSVLLPIFSAENLVK